MQTKKRVLSLLLSGVMVFSLSAPSVYADDAVGGGITSSDGLCEHHPEHTEDCGYTEGTPEAPCTHEHTPDCYTQVTECVHEHTADCYPEAEDGVSGEQEREPENCAHVCSEESGCITKELNCQHEHNGECGYSPAVEGTPCGYVCESCNPQGGETEPPAPSNGEESTAGEKLQARPGALSKTMSGTLTIGGKSVTGTNPDVLGDGGSVAYDEGTNTITLTDCRLSEGQIVCAFDPDTTLNIQLVRNNSLKMINVASNLKIIGNGCLRVENSDSTGIQLSTQDSHLDICDGADVTVISNDGNGIYVSGSIKISDSTVNASSDSLYSRGIYSFAAIEIDNSKVTAGGYYAGLQGDGGVTIQNGSEIEATSTDDCGIFSPAAIEIHSSKVTAEGYYAGLRGNEGVVIQNSSEVISTSSDDCGIFSPTTVKIDNSKVTAEGYYVGLQGNESIAIQNSSKVKATSTAVAGICSTDIVISGSEVKAEGYYCGLQKYYATNDQGDEIIDEGKITIKDSKVAATATVPIEDADGSGIYTRNDLEVENSEIYADGSSYGIFIWDQGTISNSWIDAGKDIGIDPNGDYKSSNSVTIYGGEGWVTGQAEVPEDVILSEGDKIKIQTGASLSVGGVKISGGVGDGATPEITVTVNENKELALPAGTIISLLDGETLQVIREEGGTISLDGKVTGELYYVTLEYGEGGTDQESAELKEAGTTVTLPIPTPATGYRFKEWQVERGDGVTILNNSFTMPKQNVIIKAVFEKNNDSGSTGGSGSSSGSSSSGGSIFSYDGDDDEDDDSSDSSRDSSSAPVYGRETLTSGGVALSGSRVHQSARLTVTKDRLHGSGDCTYCDQLRQWRRQGRVIAIYDVALSRGFRGTVTLTFPVPSQYNGKTLTVVHCLKDKLDTFDVTASGGKVTVTVDSLSPFAILDGSVPDGLDEDEGGNPNTGAC